MTALQDESFVEPERREVGRLTKHLTYEPSEDDVATRPTWRGKANNGNVVVPKVILACELAVRRASYFSVQRDPPVQATVDALQEERQRMADSEQQHAAQLDQLASQHEARLNAMRTEQDKILCRLGRALEANGQLRDQFDALKEHLERHCVDISRIPACDRRRIRDYCAQFNETDDDLPDVGDEEKIEKSRYLEADDASAAVPSACKSGTRARRRRRIVRKKKQAGHTSRPHQQQSEKRRRAPRAERLLRDSSSRGKGIYTLNGYAPAGVRGES